MVARMKHRENDMLHMIKNQFALKPIVHVIYALLRRFLQICVGVASLPRIITLHFTSMVRQSSSFIQYYFGRSKVMKIVL